MKYVNLHSHTVFSIGDGLNYPKDHFDFVLKNAGDTAMAMAISDHGNANSFGYAFHAQEQMKKKGINFKFIPAVEFYYHPDLEAWKAAKKAKAEGVEVLEDVLIEVEEDSRKKWYDPIKRRHHLCVVAYNSVGLTNLYRLVSRSYRKGFYRYPRIDNKMLEECREGLVISTACISGIPAWLAFRDQNLTTQELNKVFDNELKPLLDIFGRDHAYLEIQFNKLEEQRFVNDALLNYSEHSGYKLLATADSHYADPKYWRDRELYRLLSWQSMGKDSSAEDLPSDVSELKCELYPKNGEQMFAEYSKMYGEDPNSPTSKLIKEAIVRSYDIAHDLCDFAKQDSTIKLPKRKTKKTFYETLEDLCIGGMVERNLHLNEEYIERLEMELRVIRLKDFANYFVILHEAMTEIKKHQLSSPGRGSAASCLVLYLIGITQVDPIKNGLLFERFLSEHRSDPPDVDCLASNTKVKTPKGYTEIGDLVVGNVVIDSFGHPQKITNVMPRKSRKNEILVRTIIKTIHGFCSVVSSRFHKFLLVDSTIIQAKDLRVGDILLGDMEFFVWGFETVRKSLDLVDISVENSKTFKVAPFPMFLIETNKLEEFLIPIDVYDVDIDRETERIEKQIEKRETSNFILL